MSRLDPRAPRPRGRRAGTRTPTPGSTTSGGRRRKRPRRPSRPTGPCRSSSARCAARGRRPPPSSGAGASRRRWSPRSARSPRPSTTSRARARGSEASHGGRWSEPGRRPAAAGATSCSRPWLALDRATVVVTHFVAINVAVGAATGDDRLVCFRPDNCSRTVLDNDGGRLRLVELGAEVDAVPQPIA